MSYLTKGRKEDLIVLATELGLDVGNNSKVIQLKDLIIKSTGYDEDLTKNLLSTIIEERIAKEKSAELQRITLQNVTEQENLQRLAKEKEIEEARIEKARAHELEILKLQLEVQKLSSSSTAPTAQTAEQPRLELKKLVPNFNVKEDDISLFLNLFERQLKFLKVPENQWVAYLVGVLPSDITKIIAREPEEKAEDYSYIKELLLKRFKLSAERFRQLFATHKKIPEVTWQDFYFEIRSYFENWIKEANVNTFEKLQDLIITDQIKKRCPPEFKEHFLDEWGDIISPTDLVEKLDAYDNLRQKTRREGQTFTTKKPFPKLSEEYPKYYPEKKNWEHQKPMFGKKDRDEPPKYNPVKKDVSSRKFEKPKQEEPSSVYCYNCGIPGYIKSNCPNCPKSEKNFARFHSIQLNSLSTSSQMAILGININGLCGTAYADTAATHTIAGEILYKLLKEQGTCFRKSILDITLADGSQSSKEVEKAYVQISLANRRFTVPIFAIPEAQQNNTLLGIDFIEKSGIVLNLKEQSWYFADRPKKVFCFAKLDVSPISNTHHPDENKIPEIKEVANQSEYISVPVEDFSNEVNHTVPENSLLLQTEVAEESIDSIEFTNYEHSTLLRPNEGENLNSCQKKQLNALLREYEDIFRQGGEATPYIEHRIDTGDSAPIASPPYRLSPARKEVLKKLIENLLATEVIEECDSPYASPAVLIPKPNNEFRLCIDYRKLNAVTKSDPYPLPRMDDLLHNAKQTAFMTTIDLRSGYYQIKIHPQDRDKTAFVCQFGVFRFKRMPFGLKNAPATFQRLMDIFRNGLKVNTLVYLDDIIVMSPTFEDHLQDLRLVFKRLQQFKLRANREKCRFSCDKVKYLGHFITSSGIEVDPAKVEAILGIPPPKDVKQLQSFLQTCSWYRRYIPQFAQISRPLSNLTKKRTIWQWGEKEQSAFEFLKTSLTSPPVLKQIDESKPFVIRSDASNYALGAVLLQGQGPDEHPIEYASRLLTPAECNYSTTEREALAVIWALDKFRGYIEGAEVTVASDHQPLKWLLSLKSPTGRLARWALKLQAYNVKIAYIPGKMNVTADMLSRPSCNHEKANCEICTIIVDLPSRSASDLRSEQLKDNDVKKIIDTFESGLKDENYANWTQRGYVMNQGVLYRYSQESDSEEAQLVIPIHKREEVLKEHHDAPTAGHYGVEGTFQRISKRYYFPGMRKYIANYVKNCDDCNRFKPSNQKPAGLLRTPIYSQRFETLAIDLFGPLPESPDGKKWIFLIEDTATKWVELFALQSATAKECATVLMEEIFLRYGIPRRLISDNGSQFVSAVLQQVCHLLDIKQILTPVYCPQANPVERKNRDLKPRLAILVGDNHNEWPQKLPTIRFSLNTAVCESTEHTAAFLMFGRELRTPSDIRHDLRTVIHNDNFVAEITPYLRKFVNLTKEIKDIVEQKQDQRKKYADQERRKVPQYVPGDHVWVTLHPHSDKAKKKTAKFAPRRDGPYIILNKRSATSYEIASLDNPLASLGAYHTSALRPCLNDNQTTTVPTYPIRKRGRPPKPSPNSDFSKTVRTNASAGHLPGRRRSQRGSL